MSNASSEYAREKTSRSLDTIAVYNPTDNDEVIWIDRFGPQANKTLVPGKDKDIGHGKGIAHLPRFKAQLYAEKMITFLVTKISDEKWSKDQKQYRTRDEKIQHAEVEQIRTNNPNYWFLFCPSKKNLERPYTAETTLESVIEAEKEYRKQQNINIPVKTVVWLGVVEKFGGTDIIDPTEDRDILDRAGFESVFS